MAKTLEEFFIQQIEAKDEEIKNLKEAVMSLNTRNAHSQEEKDILLCGVRAFGFIVEMCELKCDSEVHFGKNDVKVPARFVADFNRLKDYFEDHYIIEENGKVELRGAVL